MTNLIRLGPTTTMTAEQALASAMTDAESGHLKDVNDLFSLEAA